MFGQTFGHGTLRKYVIYFGTLFNNIWVKRYDNRGDLIQNMKVPLNYGPREKFLARLEGNPGLNRQIAIQLPRMTFEMTNMYYDPTRKLPTFNRVTVTDPDNPRGVKYQYQPVPYNIEFTLSIMTKNVEDGTYIVEQILPFFNPTWTATLNLNTDLNQKHDIPITLDAVDQEDTYEGDFINRRAIIWTLKFTMKAYFFGPTYSTANGIIKDITINLTYPPANISVLEANPNNTDPSSTIHIVPGMFANGMATSASVHLYTYSLANTNGTFDLTEKVYVDADNYAYVCASNSTSFSTRNIHGQIANGDIVIGSDTGFTGTVVDTTISPPLSVSPDQIYANSDYGFIIDIIDYEQ